MGIRILRPAQQKALAASRFPAVSRSFTRREVALFRHYPESIRRWAHSRVAAQTTFRAAVEPPALTLAMACARLVRAESSCPRLTATGAAFISARAEALFL